MTDEELSICTVPDVRNRRPLFRSRTARVGTTLTTGIVAVNVAAWCALSSIFPGVHLLGGEGGGPAPRDQRPPAAAAAVIPVETTPADVVLRAVTQRPSAELFGTGWAAVTAGAGTDAVYGSPFAYACGANLPARAVPSLSATARAQRDSHGSREGISLQLGAYPAGQAGAGRDALRSVVEQCTGRDGSDPYTYAVEVGDAPGFVAVDDVAGQVTAWLVWQRGDVLGSLTYTRLGTVSTSPVEAAADQVDGILTRALTPVCAELASLPGDATRNPYVPGYVPYGRDVRISAPDVAAPPIPQTPNVVDLPVPAPVEHPELAPPLTPRPDEYTDVDGDGFAETPPSVELARRGPAPVFADVDAFEVPADAVTAAPVEPERPVTPVTSRVAHVPTADVTGPGCGWAFTGESVPHFDTATLEQRGRAATRETLLDLTTAAAQYRVDMLDWATRYATWMDQQARYEAYERFVEARDAAAETATAAEVAYQAAAAVYSVPRLPTTPTDPDPTDPSTPPDPDPDPSTPPDPTDPSTPPIPEVTP